MWGMIGSNVVFYQAEPPYTSFSRFSWCGSIITGSNRLRISSFMVSMYPVELNQGIWVDLINALKAFHKVSSNGILWSYSTPKF